MLDIQVSAHVKGAHRTHVVSKQTAIIPRYFNTSSPQRVEYNDTTEELNVSTMTRRSVQLPCRCRLALVEDCICFVTTTHVKGSPVLETDSCPLNRFPWSCAISKVASAFKMAIPSTCYDQNCCDVCVAKLAAVWIWNE